MKNKNSIKIDFAILSAMPEEIFYFKHLLPNNELIETAHGSFKICHYHNKKILLAAIGLGTTCAAAMAAFIITSFQPNYLMFTGTAGGIANNLNVGDVVIATSAFEAEIQGAFTILPGTPFETALNHPVKKQPLQPRYFMHPDFMQYVQNLKVLNLAAINKLHLGTVVTSNTFPSPPELFAQVKTKQPLAIDMETSAIYQTAWLLNTKALVVRGISNTLNHLGEDVSKEKTDVVGGAENSAKTVWQILQQLVFAASPALPMPELAAAYIKEFELQPHPEGGYFKQVFKSTISILPSENVNYFDGEARSAGTSIYYLLIDNDFSAWHRLKSDEIWHYYDGAPLTVYTIDRESSALCAQILGNPTQTTDARFQITIKAGDWFAAEIPNKGGFTLLGCTVTPGFEFADFELANRAALAKAYPQHQAIIARLTRT